MSLAQNIKTAPIAYEPDLANDVLAAYPKQPPELEALIAGVAGCSSYLRSLLMTEQGWLAAHLDAPSDQVVAAINDFDGVGLDILPNRLRRAKRRLALYAALSDCGGAWELEQVTGALTDFADLAVDRVLKALLQAELDRGRLPGCTDDDIASACGMTVLAMGKMGAHELNYSSDIDLIVLFDETRHDAANFDDIRERFIRVTRRMARILSDVTSDGYVFRTDLRLRPDPSVTPVCLSMDAAERYYESLGRTWERAAYIKARPAAGDLAAGAGFLKTLTPFVWRKHLDFAAIQDAHDMRLRIREHKGLGGPITLDGHDMKLGRGGIREIEFFTQTRQIIAGGRDPDLRDRRTVPALQKLAEKGWIDTTLADGLTEAYRAHRVTEHRIQMLADAQTHRLPQGDEQMDRLARFSGFGDTETFRADVAERLDMVHSWTEGFFAPEPVADEAPALPENLAEMVDKWRDLPALRSARAQEIFGRLQPMILARVQAMPDPNATLIQFDRFLAGLPAGVQLFSLFEANPQLIDLLVDICGSAPVLAQYLSRNSKVFDGVIAGTFFAPLGDVDTLSDGLGAALARVSDYEDQLNAARAWMKEQHFRIGTQQLKSMIDAPAAAAHYSDLAEAVLARLFPVVAAQFAKRHGPMPGRGALVLGMGSLGAGSLTATSDLDLIVIYDAAGEEMSEGQRPLAVSAYFARLTQALVTALSSPMAEGRLYETDMRLRPSGRKGPVATALSSFKNYQATEAWTWEHLALTRARAVAGDASLAAEVEAFRQDLLAQPRDPVKTLADIVDMRRRLAEAADPARLANPWEAKMGPGRMQDIELMAQTVALLAGKSVRDAKGQIACGVASGRVSKPDGEILTKAYEALFRIQQTGRLIVDGNLDPGRLGQGARMLLLLGSGAETPDELQAILVNQSRAAEAVITRILGQAAP